MGIGLLDESIELLGRVFGRLVIDNNSELLKRIFDTYNNKECCVITIGDKDYQIIFNNSQAKKDNKEDNNSKIYCNYSPEEIKTLPDTIKSRVLNSINENISLIHLISFKIHKFFPIQERIYTHNIINTNINTYTFNVNELHCSITL